MKKIIFLTAIVTWMIALDSCKKTDISGIDKPISVDAASIQSMDAQVAIDWYKLQLRLLLERNSTLNGGYFGYLGIGLYESVRYGIKNSVSFSKSLYQMPEMPAKENNNGYHYAVSANAAMAAMLRSFNTGLTTANRASIDSLENAYNEKLSPDAGSTSFKRSQTFGRSIAAAMHDWYLTDNLNLSNAGYTPLGTPGSWIPYTTLVWTCNKCKSWRRPYLFSIGPECCSCTISSSLF